MAQHRIHDYRAPRSSEDLNTKLAGLLPPGIAGQKGGQRRIGLAPPLEKAGHNGVPVAVHIHRVCYVDFARNVPSRVISE